MEKPMSGIRFVCAVLVALLRKRLILFFMLIKHWDGVRWTSVISPNASIYFNVLSAVAASTSSDVWAVGSYDDGRLTRTLIEHSNGGLWKIVAREGGSNGTLEHN